MNKSRQSANLVSKNNIFSDITNGRVGIGTTNPQYTLDVNGNTNIVGVVTASAFYEGTTKIPNVGRVYFSSNS